MDMQEYYSNDEVLFEIVKVLSGRETTFMGKKIVTSGDEERRTFRCIKAHKVMFLKSNFRAFNFFTSQLNIYYSLAMLMDMPMFTFDMKKRKVEQNLFNDEFDKYMVGYDIGIDFDCHKYNADTKQMELVDFQQVYSDVKFVKNELDDYKVPYSLKCSGSGFHINIPDKALSEIPLMERCAIGEKLTDFLRKGFNLPSICASSLDKRRIWKCPYSFDYKSGNIALPLNDVQFENFNFNLVKPENVLRMGIRNRGLLERNSNFKGFMDMCKEYNLKQNNL